MEWKPVLDPHGVPKRRTNRVWHKVFSRYSVSAHFFGLGTCLLFVLLALELADRVTMKRDLEIAREIQQLLLPERPPEIPLDRISDEKDFYHLLHYYAFPPELWKKIRTTNVLERTFREYRRRTRPMQVFPNPESAERIYYGVTDYLNQNWEERPQ